MASERVLFGRIGMMTYYRGPQAGDERPVGGGRYNRENIGHEAWNFAPRDGWCFGYIRSGSRDESIRLDRIDPTATNADELDGVTVVFFAPKTGGGQVVVGWYRRAVVYCAAQHATVGDGFERVWCCKAKDGDACLLPQSYRKREVPHGKGATGQSNITYTYDDRGAFRLTWARDILDYVRDYDGPNLCREWLAEAEDQAATAFEVAAAAREGQSFGGAPQERKAVEEHAMQAAERHYRERGYQCDASVHKTKPYDLLCTKGRETRYVEVKGTRGGPHAVFVTRREVAHVRQNPGVCDLFILHGIDLKSTGSRVRAAGGTPVVVSPWDLQTGTLEALAYEYRLPERGG